MPESILHDIHETNKLFNYINEFLSISDLDTLLDKICEEVPKVINGRECSIFLKPDHVKDHSGKLDIGDGTFMQASELDREYIVLARTTRATFREKIGKAFYTKGFGLTGWILEKKRPLRIKDMQDEEEIRRIDKNLEWKDAYGGSKIHFPNQLVKKPFLGVPLIKGNEILGVIRVGEALKGDSFPSYSVNLLMSFAGILANLIEKVSSEESLRNSLKSLINLGATRNSKEIFKAIVKEAKSLVGAENCELYYLDPYGEKIVLCATTGGYMNILKKDEAVKPYDRGVGLTGWIFKTGKPLCLENLLEFKKERKLSDEELKAFSDGPEINNESDRKVKWSDQDDQYKQHIVPHPFFLGVPVTSEYR